MARTILIDANVIDQINRGNAAAANALLGMIRNGDTVYISQQAYNELIVNALPRGATANRLLLERLNINLAPAGSMATRVDVYASNQARRSGTVVSEPDSLVAAQARAISAELWSFDRAFRNQGGVTTTLGVRVAPECTTIPLAGAGTGGRPPEADYRVGYRLLGLPPVEINFSGQILRRGPPGSPPGMPGTPPASLGGGGGGSTGGGTAVAGRGSTTAVIGVADNRLPEVGGPSPRGTAIVNGIQLAFQGANFILNWLNDREQERRVRQELAQIEPSINQQRATNPSLGVLLIFFYRQVKPAPDSLIRPGAVFISLEYVIGRSRDEALANWQSQSAIRQGARRDEQISTQEVWIAPIRPAGVAALRTPFPPAAIGTFASATATRLQDVEWGGVTGFDDEGQTTLRLRAGSSPPEFVILRPPAVIHWFNGPARYSTEIPLVSRTAAEGTNITVIDLDPWMPGNVSAAMVFPTDDATDELFSQASQTRDNLNQLRGYVNFGKVRWIRPENIRVLRLIT